MKRWKALLVDDEEEFVATLAERLRLRGIVVEVATDGQDALARLDEVDPRVVVLDIMMPGVGGLAVLRHIRENRPDVAVILLTGRGTTKEGMEGMRLGAFDFMMKPVRIEELIARMIEAVEKSRPEQPGGAE